MRVNRRQQEKPAHPRQKRESAGQNPRDQGAPPPHPSDPTPGRAQTALHPGHRGNPCKPPTKKGGKQ